MENGNSKTRAAGEERRHQGGDLDEKLMAIQTLGADTPGEGPASTRACRWAHSAPAWLHHSLRLLSLIVCVCTRGVYHTLGDTGLLPSPPGCSAQLNCEGWSGWEGLLEGGRRRMCGKGGELSREGRFGLKRLVSERPSKPAQARAGSGRKASHKV